MLKLVTNFVTVAINNQENYIALLSCVSQEQITDSELYINFICAVMNGTVLFV